jgi:hypothetical protein
MAFSFGWASFGWPGWLGSSSAYTFHTLDRLTLSSAGLNPFVDAEQAGLLHDGRAVQTDDLCHRPLSDRSPPAYQEILERSPGVGVGWGQRCS